MSLADRLYRWLLRKPPPMQWADERGRNIYTQIAATPGYRVDPRFPTRKPLSAKPTGKGFRLYAVKDEQIRRTG